MPRRTQNRRAALTPTTLVALFLTACGAGATPGSHPTAAPSASPTSMTTAAPATSTTTLAPSPSPSVMPSSSPSPAPEPPLAVLAQGQDLKMINGQGVEQWELTDPTMEQIFGVTAQQVASEGFGVTAEEAGPNLVLFDGDTSNPADVAASVRPACSDATPGDSSAGHFPVPRQLCESMQSTIGNGPPGRSRRAIPKERTV
jgi:hypothetical protein